MLDYSLRSPSMDSDSQDDSTPPTEILTIAIRKRRELHEAPEHDLYREILNRKLIQHLCRQLGQKHSRRHSRRRGGSRSTSKRRSSTSGDDYETTEKRYRSMHEEEEGDSNPNGFEITASSMVCQGPSSVNYGQMERMLDANEVNRNPTQFSGYVAYWMSPGCDPSSSVQPSISDSSTCIPLVPSLDDSSNLSFTDTLVSDSSFSNTDSVCSSSVPLTDLADASPSSPPPDYTQEDAKKDKSSNCENVAVQSRSVEDPLEMNELFAKLYRSSYSIIVDASKDFGSTLDLLLVDYL